MRLWLHIGFFFFFGRIVPACGCWSQPELPLHTKVCLFFIFYFFLKKKVSKKESHEGNIAFAQFEY